MRSITKVYFYVPLAFFVCWLVTYLLSGESREGGLASSEPFSIRNGEREAKADISLGVYRIYGFGLPADPAYSSTEATILRERYGIRRSNFGCDVTARQVEFVEKYNEVMVPFLLEKFGKDIFEKASIEADRDVAHRITMRSLEEP